MTTQPERPPETLVTSRLVLRRPTLADAPGIYAYGSDPEVTRYLMFRTHTSLADAEGFVGVCQRRWEAGEGYNWVITRRGGDTVMGTFGVRVRDHSVTIGYSLARAHWSQGHATEAGRAVVAWAADRHETHRIWAACDTANAASARVLEKLGMSREGVLRRWLVHPNVSSIPRDGYVYAMIRDSGASFGPS